MPESSLSETPANDVARAYVGLAHALEQHQPGIIDGYFGPEAWKVAERRPLAALAQEAERLADRAAALSDPDRLDFLTVQIRALRTSVALLAGAEIPYRQEVRDLYDIEAEAVPEARFEAALAELEGRLPGRGSRQERLAAFRRRFEIPAERLEGLSERIFAELRERTRARFGLPAGEGVELRLVSQKHWGAYNWYLGGFRSLIEVNTDLPRHLFSLPHTLAHEAYPGHHSEHALKEEGLYRRAGRGEHGILLINAPECVVSEGIATRALAAVMTQGELREWLCGELLTLSELEGVDPDDMAAMLGVMEIEERLRSVRGNAALRLHVDHAPEGEVRDYLMHFGLYTPEQAAKALEFFRHPLARSYSFTYTVGAELLDRLFERGDAGAWFGRLLREPVTPAGIRRWIERDA